MRKAPAWTCRMPRDTPRRGSDRSEGGVSPRASPGRDALFAGSDEGADRWAIVASLIETARRNSVEPFAWLRDVLARMVAGHSSRKLDGSLELFGRQRNAGEGRWSLAAFLPLCVRPHDNHGSYVRAATLPGSTSKARRSANARCRWTARGCEASSPHAAVARAHAVIPTWAARLAICASTPRA